MPPHLITLHEPQNTCFAAIMLSRIISKRVLITSLVPFQFQNFSLFENFRLNKCYCYPIIIIFMGRMLELTKTTYNAFFYQIVGQNRIYGQAAKRYSLDCLIARTHFADKSAPGAHETW